MVQCCINNAEAMFSLLLESGADVNALDSEHWSPLHAAAACGRVTFCEALCERSASVPFWFSHIFRADSFIHSLILGLWWMLTINFAINYSRTLTTKICFKD